jgi:hypothetical protein
MIRFHFQCRLKAPFGLQSFVQGMKGFSEDVEDALGLVIYCFCRILRLTNFYSQLKNYTTKLNWTKPNKIEPDQIKSDRTKPNKVEPDQTKLDRAKPNQSKLNQQDSNKYA